MNINRHNYEPYALDYLDGILTPVEMASFMAFLAENQDISKEIEALRENLTTLPISSKSVNFSFLKKNISEIPMNDNNFEEICIAWHEGDLSPDYLEKINCFIANDQKKRKTFNDYGKLKLIPDRSIIFKGKSTLKKQKSVITLRRTVLIASLSAAASVAVFFILNNSKGTNAIEIANYTQTILNQYHTELYRPMVQSSQKMKTNTITIVTDKHKRIEHTAQKQNINTGIAVFDTNNPPIDIVELKKIEPVIIETNTNTNELAIRDISKTNKRKTEPEIIEKFITKGAGLYAKANTLTLNEVISTGINGINQMTETNLKFHSKSDNKGNIVEFALSSDNFIFKRKVDHN